MKDLACKIVCVSLIFFLPRLAVSKELQHIDSFVSFSEPHAEAVWRNGVKNIYLHFPDIESSNHSSIKLGEETSIYVEAWYRMPYDASDYISIPMKDGGIPVYGSDQYWGLQIVYTIPQEEGTYTFEESFTSSRVSSNTTTMGTYSTWKTVCKLYVEDGEKKTSWENYEYYWDYPNGRLVKKWEVSGWNDAYQHEIIFYKTYTALQEDWFGVWPVEIKINGVVVRERKIYTRGLTIRKNDWDDEVLDIYPENFFPGGDRRVSIMGKIIGIPTSGDATWSPTNLSWQLKILDGQGNLVDEQKDGIDSLISWEWNGILSSNEFASPGNYSVTVNAQDSGVRTRVSKIVDPAFKIISSFMFTMNHFKYEPLSYSDDVIPGEEITYEIIYRCTYEGGTKDVRITCTLPLYTRLVEGSCSKTPDEVNSTHLVWELGDLKEGEGGSITFVVQANDILPRSLKSLENKATLAYSLGGGSVETLEDEETVNVDQGVLVVSFSKRSLKPDGESTSDVKIKLYIPKIDGEIPVKSADVKISSLSPDIGKLSKTQVTTDVKGEAALTYTAPTDPEVKDLKQPITLELTCEEEDSGLTNSDAIYIGETNLKGTVYDVVLKNFLNWKGSGSQHNVVRENLPIYRAVIMVKDLESDETYTVKCGIDGAYALELGLSKYEIEVRGMEEGGGRLTYKEEIDTLNGEIPSPYDFHLPISLLEEQRELIDTLTHLKVPCSDTYWRTYFGLELEVGYDMSAVQGLVNGLRENCPKYYGVFTGVEDTEEDKNKKDLWNVLIRLIAFEAALKVRFDDYAEMADTLVNGLVVMVLGNIMDEILDGMEWNVATVDLEKRFGDNLAGWLKGMRELNNGFVMNYGVPLYLQDKFSKIASSPKFQEYIEISTRMIDVICKCLTGELDIKDQVLDMAYQLARVAGVKYLIEEKHIPDSQKMLDEMVGLLTGDIYSGHTNTALNRIDNQNTTFKNNIKGITDLISKSAEQANTIYKSIEGCFKKNLDAAQVDADSLKEVNKWLTQAKILSQEVYGIAWLMPPYLALPYVYKDLEEIKSITLHSGIALQQSLIHANALYTLWSPTYGKIYSTEVNDYNNILFQIMLMLSPENRDQVEALTSQLIKADVALSDNLDELYHRLSACSWTVVGLNPVLDFSGGVSSTLYQTSNLERALLYSLLYIWLSDPEDEETRAELITQANDTIWSNGLVYLSLDFSNLQLLPVLAPPFLVVTDIDKPALYAGSEGTLTVTIKNKGDETANGVTVTLLTGNQETTVTSPEVTLGQIGKDEEKTVSWEISASGFEQGSVLYFQVLLEGEDLLPKEETFFIIVK